MTGAVPIPSTEQAPSTGFYCHQMVSILYNMSVMSCYVIENGIIGILSLFQFILCVGFSDYVDSSLPEESA